MSAPRGLGWVRGRVAKTLEAAYRGGMRDPADLTRLLDKELRALGFDPLAPSVRVEATQSGTRIVMRLGLDAAHTRVSAGAVVVDAQLARCQRTCGCCFGIGCGRCEGRGWVPRKRRAA